MKKILFVVVIVILIAAGLWFFNGSNNASFGGVRPSSDNLVGSSSNAVSIPNVMAFADATSTDSSFYADGGQTLTQRIDTGNVPAVRLDILAIGGTATSTFSIRQQVSQDGDNWFNIHASSTPSNIGIVATATPVSLIPAGLVFDPGTASTSNSFIFDTTGAKFTRFIFLGDDLATDPNDGIQAWVQATKLETVY